MRSPLPIVCEPRRGLRAPEVGDAAAFAALLADRTRASILRMLGNGPHCVCEIAITLRERENNVSNHLAKLRDAGLVRATRHHANARFLYYERAEDACVSALAQIRKLLVDDAVRGGPAHARGAAASSTRRRSPTRAAKRRKRTSAAGLWHRKRS